MPAPTALPIALQLYTIRDPMNADLEQALAQVAAIGYSNVEMAGLHGRTPEDFKRLLDQHGLKAIAAHEGLPDSDDDIRAIIGRARTFGYTCVVIPYLAPEFRGLQGYGRVAQRLSPLAERLADDGLTLAYHNHAFEFEPLPDGQLGIDILLADDAIASELDVYWVQKAGGDPIAWIRKLSGRVPFLHMKDMTDDADRKFAEVGTGTVPLKQIAAIAADHGVRCLIVEQDSNWKVSPLESARVSYENLTKMLG